VVVPIDDALTLPGWAGFHMRNVTVELRAHGYRQASLDLATRAVILCAKRLRRAKSSRPISIPT